MEYNVEDVSPVKKKINVQAPADEVHAALSAATAMYGKDVEMKGFRKGKVPSSVVEGRFKKKIYTEATNDLINVHINQIMSEMQFNPLSRIDVDADLLERGKDFNYSISFEVAPVFELPPYKGIGIEEEEVQVNTDEVDLVINRIQNNMAELVIIEEERPPKDNEVVVIDFEAFEDGKSIEGVKADNFQMTLGEGAALPDFEELIKELKPGETGTREITLPDDFINSALAGKTVQMQVTLHSIKEKKLPEVDEELAQKAGGFDSVEKLKQVIENSYKSTRKELHKSSAQKKALDDLKTRVDFELPDSLVQGRIQQKITALQNQLEKKGKRLESIGKTREELAEEFRPHAEDMVKSQLFLLAVAKTEGLTVSEDEMDAYIQKQAQAGGQEPAQLKKFYQDNNLMFALQDTLLADKAMEFIYEHAEIKMVPPQTGDSTVQSAQA
ncbi:trigger factor [Desulfonatronospira sp.]|uniref:trigger factor n=1 Tax=Desulfonatronospira sp. TaxID=1962951 RepID=UPI0025BC3E78|nr:trigger factor [Desulfonatronospira sp.]